MTLRKLCSFAFSRSGMACITVKSIRNGHQTAALVGPLRPAKSRADCAGGRGSDWRRGVQGMGPRKLWVSRWRW
jgi:hypothetical protein